MKMFGFIWGIITGIGAAISLGNRISENNMLNENGKKRDLERIERGEVPIGTYTKIVDGRWCTFDRETGKQVYVTRENGELVVLDIYTNEAIRNVTRQQMEADREKDVINSDENDVIIELNNYTEETIYRDDYIDILGKPKPIHLTRGAFLNKNTGEKYFGTRQFENIFEEERNHLLRFIGKDCFRDVRIINAFETKETEDRIKELEEKIKEMQNIHISWIDFYINESGFIVGISDNCKQKHNKEKEDSRRYVPTEEEIQTFIDCVNTFQGRGGWDVSNINLKYPKKEWSSYVWSSYYLQS